MPCEKGGTIDVWLDSPGGDAHAAYKLALFLSSRFETINFVVPDFAKSAATLLSLVGDRLYMSCSAEIGPLDLQQTREGEVQTRSAISTADSIEFIFQHAFDNALFYGAHVMHATRLSREKSVSQMLNFSAQLFQPLMAQLDPVAIHAAATGLLVTIEYGVRLLKGKRPGVPDEELMSVVSRLVRDYPVHGFIIDINEARDIGLPVDEIASYPLLREMKTIHGEWQKHFGDTIRVMDKDEVTKLAGEIESSRKPKAKEVIGESVPARNGRMSSAASV
jgi:hypothetical protein